MNLASPSTWKFLLDTAGKLLVRVVGSPSRRLRVRFEDLFELEGQLCTREPGGVPLAVVPIRPDLGGTLADPPPADVAPPFHTLPRDGAATHRPDGLLTEIPDVLANAALAEACPHLPLFRDPAAGGPPPARHHVRGTALLDPREAWHSSHLGTDAAPRFAFGGVFIPPADAVKHFLFMGLPETGKTTLIRTLLTGALHHRAFHPRYTPRALVFDAKGDMYPFLERLRPGQVVSLNPFVADSFAWDIGPDLTDRAELEFFAHSIVPLKDDEDNKNRFFSSAARAFLIEVLVALRAQRGTQWSLRDVVLAAHPPDLPKLLSRTATGQRTLEAHLALRKQYRASTDDVLSTLGNYVHPLQTVASAWESARQSGRTFSFRTWRSTTGYILVLGYDPLRNAALEPLNRHFLRAAHAFIFRGRPRMVLPDTWIVLDELALAPRFDELRSLLVAGRQYGAAVVCAFQSRPDLVTHLGGDEERVRGILDVCQNVAMFRMGTQTAPLASELAGQQEVVIASSSDGTSTNTTRGWTVTDNYGEQTGAGYTRSANAPPGLFFPAEDYATSPALGGPGDGAALPRASNVGLGSHITQGVNRGRANAVQEGKGDGTTSSRTYNFGEVRNIPPDLFTSIPNPDPEATLPGVFRSPSIGLWSAHLDARWVARHTADPMVLETFVPRPEGDLEPVREWAPEERMLLLGDPTPPPPFTSTPPPSDAPKPRKPTRRGLRPDLFDEVGNYTAPRPEPARRGRTTRSS